MAHISGMVGLAEAALTLGIPYQDAHRLLLVGTLRGEKIGSRWWVRREDVDRVAAERQAKLEQVDGGPDAAGHRPGGDALDSPSNTER